MNLEKSDLEKQKLKKASAMYKRELENEIKSISKRTEKVVTNALFIGGALALTYFAVTQFTASKSKKKKSKQQKHERDDEMEESNESSSPNMLSQVGDILVTQATMVLLEFAKEKLSEYLHSRKATDEDS
ncbi:MAG TPA: hypothetical protein PK185_14545 [Cyclobacteriaceae bacterium]|nr:hypothetical protein [Cyclobacteriaceae bacterium]HRK55134.1 hypothetical protein [Cyclobacteriaceae bacterium]